MPKKKRRNQGLGVRHKKSKTKDFKRMRKESPLRIELEEEYQQAVAAYETSLDNEDEVQGVHTRAMIERDITTPSSPAHTVPDNENVVTPEAAPATDADVVSFLEDEISYTKLLGKPQKIFRFAVAWWFVRKYNAVENTSDTPWHGKGGIISKIRKDLDIHRNTSITPILEDVRFIHETGYEGGLYEYIINNTIGTRGRKSIIKIDSHEAQIIADQMECGASTKIAWNAVNICKEEKGLCSVTLSAVKGVIRKMKPQVILLGVHRQGSMDENSNTCKARLGWCLQLGIRLGILEYEDFFMAQNPSANKDTITVPRWYDKEKLTPIDISQVAWWDEVHRKCIAGMDGEFAIPLTNKSSFLRFPRDENGRIDLENGKYIERDVTTTKVKYADEVRLSLGCALRPNEIEGEEDEALMLPCFVYSGHKLISISDYKKKLEDEIRSLRSMSHADKLNKGWLRGVEDASTLFLDDPVTKLPGVRAAMANILMQHGIQTIGDCKQKIVEQESLLLSVKGIGKKLINKWKDAAFNVQQMNRPPMEDMTLADNPFERRWRGNQEKIKKHQKAAIGRFICISELVDHIYEETKKCFEGTKYEENFFFYHDALSLMTSSDCMDYMVASGKIKHWILPEQGLFSSDHDPSLKAYIGRPVGNSPELMPLDSSLNKDIHEAVNRHLQLTYSLKVRDPKKFSLSTYKTGTSAYIRIIHDEISPSKKRIRQDIIGVKASIKEIVKEKGKVIPDNNQRTGRRWCAGKSSNWGGARKKNENVTNELRIGKIHTDAEGCVQNTIKDSIVKFEGNGDE